MKTSKFTKRFCGLEGMLAIKNYKRNRQRYRSIVLSLTLSVVLYVSANSFGTYLNQAAGSSSEAVEEYDICFFTRDMEESELLGLYEVLRNADGVTKSAYQALATYSLVLDTKELTGHFLEEFGETIGYDGTGETVEVQLDIQFIPDDMYRNLLAGLGLSAEEYSGWDENMIMAGILPEKWYMQKEPMIFTLYSETAEQPRTIRATFVQDYPDLLPAEPGEWRGYSLLLIAPYSVKPQFDALEATVKPVKLGMTFQSENPSASVAQMQRMIEGAGVTADYSLYNVYEIMEENRNILFIVNLFSGGFIIMITLIAVANVFNTISTNIKLRRRELAMLRSVGMSDRDFNRMMRFECILYGVRTMLFSLPVSGFLSWLIYEGLVLGGGEIGFVFPWSSMLVSVLGVFFIVFITMLYAAGRIKRENIIEVLRDELS